MGQMWQPGVGPSVGDLEAQLASLRKRIASNPDRGEIAALWKEVADVQARVLRAQDELAEYVVASLWAVTKEIEGDRKGR